LIVEEREVERLPRLRTDIQLLPTEVRGRQALAVKDMLGLRDEAVALVPQIAVLLPLFDGDHTLLDLQEAMMRSRGNQLVMRAEAEKLIQDLDDLLILQTDGYLRRKQEVRRDFAAQELRRAALAGSGYPEDPDDCRRLVSEMLAQPEPLEPFPALRALVVPHIDLRVGKRVYAQAYGRLADRGFQRIVVLGTGHGLDDGLFSLSTKRYVTPLGSFPPDLEAVERLRLAGAGCLSPDDFAHRNEHSIEFQVLFLSALLERDIPLVPILAGGLGDRLAAGSRLAEFPDTLGFLGTLRELCGPETLIVAGVDFCHVGPKFGHPEPAGVYQVDFQEHDRRLLAALCQGSPEEFWAEVQGVQDRFHVCGFPALATLLEILPGAAGRVLGYEVWHEAATRSAVSFAAAVIA
jgi:hypothetical protein